MFNTKRETSVGEILERRTPFFTARINQDGEQASWSAEVFISRAAIAMGMARDILWDLGFDQGRQATCAGQAWSDRTRLVKRTAKGVLFSQYGGLDI
jgi:hypothetical protein